MCVCACMLSHPTACRCWAYKPLLATRCWSTCCQGQGKGLAGIHGKGVWGSLQSRLEAARSGGLLAAVGPFGCLYGQLPARLWSPPFLSSGSLALLSRPRKCSHRERGTQCFPASHGAATGIWGLPPLPWCLWSCFPAISPLLRPCHSTYNFYWIF